MLHNRKITGIMACDPNGVIGKNGELPWSYPEELDHFRRTTDNHIIIMGRNTYESTPPDILKDRVSVVFSRSITKSQVSDDSLVFVSSMEEFMALSCLPRNKKLFMIGGGDLAKAFFATSLMTEFLLTKIHQTHEGDTFFPLHLLEGWSQTCIRQERDFTIYNSIKPGEEP